MLNMAKGVPHWWWLAHGHRNKSRIPKRRASYKPLYDIIGAKGKQIPTAVAVSPGKAEGNRERDPTPKKRYRLVNIAHGRRKGRDREGKPAGPSQSG